MKRFNRAFAGAGQAARTPISRHVLARVRAVSLVLAAVLAVVLLLGWAGFFGRGDAHLRGLYYDVRGTYAEQAEVVFVAMDEYTGEAWGPPPWSWERYREMLSAILSAEPRAVAVLEPGPRVLPDTEPGFDPALARAVAEGQVIIPTPAAGLGQPALLLQRNLGVEAIALTRAAEGPADAPRVASVTAQLIQAAGLPLPEGDTLWVHYIGGPDSLPTVPAHRIATGEIPPSTFSNRVVVIGMRGERFAPLVPTPIGPLAPAEVHAYALRGLLQDAVWAPMPLWARGLLVSSLALMCLALLPFIGLRRSVVLVAALGFAILIADYTLFALGLVRLGATAPLVTLGLASTATWMHERRQVLRELKALSRWSARHLALENAGRYQEEGFDELWERFARTSRTFTQFESTLLGELPDRRWHLSFERALGVSPDQIQELRRDVRREPYKTTFLMHRPTWSDHYMDDGLEQKTLLVPLTSFNHILGLWVINYRRGVEVPSSTLRMIEHLAEQLALTMERRRIRRLLGAHDKEREGLLLRPILETRSTVQFFAHEQSSLAQTFESLPVGVLVATMWGEIEYVNAAMRRFFTTLNVDGVAQRSLPDLITALTDATENEVHETVIRLFAGSPFVELGCHPDVDASYQVTLSSLSAAPLLAQDEASGAPATGLSHLVLTVTRRAAAADQAVRQSAVSGG